LQQHPIRAFSLFLELLQFPVGSKLRKRINPVGSTRSVSFKDAINAAYHGHDLREFFLCSQFQI
jgi:hypothetical protein